MNSSVSPTTAFSMLTNESENCILVDVRSAGEFNNLHAQPAMHIPLEQITSPESVSRLKSKKVLCICQSGMRGRKAVEALVGEGLTDVVNVEGGTTAWSNENLPTVRGKQSISIERQVRITAGALVFIGCLTGLIVTPYFLAIPFFVGAGLVFSGITDTCGMGLVLARCPWNSR